MVGKAFPAFIREGMFNSHNFHVWSQENPHATRSRSTQEQFSEERHLRRPSRWAVLVARKSDRCKLSDLPAASIAAAAGRRAHVR
ncbi:hypothetical protein AVEN_267214-1 [Araneus ventricosus]|uniref:Uncharacterized protein n=1 Tax=Araneus ventricosus TaxID=182803 RepID=A0A4Y2L328_ARAVE|nr:hypothetical protein AVEN_267214-1 [Araneus ventricosus]